MQLKVHCEYAPDYAISLTEDFSGLPLVLEQLGFANRKVCVVSDSNVFSLYGAEVMRFLEKEYSCFSYVFLAGEASKNLETVEGLYEYLIENYFDRNDILIALGGGVTGDLTGFAAATYLRGIRYIGIPTSLLSMVDSSIGGKTGVDFKAFKNMVGAFYPPAAVYINTSVLTTLPKREFLAGMGEVVKHALIKDRDYFSFLCKNREAIMRGDKEELSSMIYQSLWIKRQVVENDPKECGERALLNFGHTVGHAVEKLSGFSLLHGECVSIGLVVAARISVRFGTMSEQEYEDTVKLLNSFGMMTVCPAYNTDQIISVCHHDKKADGKEIRFILLSGIGSAYITTTVTDTLLKEVLSETEN